MEITLKDQILLDKLNSDLLIFKTRKKLYNKRMLHNDKEDYKYSSNKFFEYFEVCIEIERQIKEIEDKYN